ncbi:hypothetical protein CALVIDRAFT_113730 [Calocera viscosa TUFC12733]|uniref:Uncharacterized protein n=1 Tax=Calocera viscosa (strain TUFC12733) TaxID=1330018 RepID=A0A167M576_CALVF|nr:hypothetical protein CALVIDRAFT_113730 [Calocera viscosa TUFC12733]
MENKFLPFEALHDCFHLARRATGLPPSRILSGGVWYSSQASLHTLPEESTSEIEIAPLAETPTHDLVEANPDPQTSRSTDSEPPDWSISPVENIISESDALDFEGKRPPPLRLKNLLDARRSRMVRRHSIAASIPSSPPDEEEGTPTRRSPLLFTHLRRRSSLGSFNSRCATPTRPTWGAPSVAFDPPAPSMTYSDSSPDSGAEVDTPISRPSTSTGSYYTMTRTPSVTSFQVMDSVRQSFQQAKFDPEMAETLFRGATAQHFLRIFRAE